jgi:hypothetical protein
VVQIPYPFYLFFFAFLFHGIGWKSIRDGQTEIAQIACQTEPGVYGGG